MPRKKKAQTAEENPYRHHHEPLDYLEEAEKSLEMHCPDCARAQRHVHLVETEGRVWECPECRLLLRARRG